MSLLSFDDSHFTDVDGDFTLPVPAGFRLCRDPALIGSALCAAVIPKDYSFPNDPMDAPIALCFQANRLDCGAPFDPACAVDYVRAFAEADALSPTVETAAVGMRPGFGALYQHLYDPADPSWNTARGVLCVDTAAYYFHLIYNHPGEDATDPTLAAEFSALANDWLARILLPSEAAFMLIPKEEDFPEEEEIPEVEEEAVIPEAEEEESIPDTEEEESIFEPEEEEIIPEVEEEEIIPEPEDEPNQ